MQKVLIFCFCGLVACSSPTTIEPQPTTDSGKAGSGGSGIGGSGGLTAGSGGSATGGTGASDGSAAGGSGGGSGCTSVTGTYVLNATRDSSNAGSCPNNTSYLGNPSVTITLNTTGGYDYKLQGDLANAGTNCTAWSAFSCTASVSGCRIQASCVTNTLCNVKYQSDMVLNVTDTSVSGTDQWQNLTLSYPACSANWNLTGSRL